MLGVKKEIKVRDRAQREQRRKRDPRTARALEKENKTLKRLNKTVRDEIVKGKLDRIITADDMSRLAKYSKNRKAREIAFIKDGEGTQANSQEEAIQNLSQAYFLSSIPLSEDTITDRMLTAGSERGIKKVAKQSYVNDKMLVIAKNSFGSKKSLGIDGITPMQMKLFGGHCRGIL